MKNTNTGSDRARPLSGFRIAQRNSIPFWAERGAPVVTARPASSQVWLIDCPWCGQVHRHGAIEGHRLSHCADPALRAGPGYILVLERAA